MHVICGGQPPKIGQALVDSLQAGCRVHSVARIEALLAIHGGQVYLVHVYIVSVVSLTTNLLIARSLTAEM